MIQTTPHPSIIHHWKRMTYQYYAFVTGKTDKGYDAVIDKREVKPRDFRTIQESWYVIYN